MDRRAPDDAEVEALLAEYRGALRGRAGITDIRMVRAVCIK